MGFIHYPRDPRHGIEQCLLYWINSRNFLPIKSLLKSTLCPAHQSLLERIGKFRGKHQNQDWLYVPPQNLIETKTVQNRVYSWCTKCNRENGQWVITHTDSTHRDDFRHPNKHQVGTKRLGILKQADVAQLNMLMVFLLRLKKTVTIKLV